MTVTLAGAAAPRISPLSGQTAGNVNRQAIEPALCDCVNRGAHRTREGAIEAGAEDRIDDKVGIIEKVGRKGGNRATPVFRGTRGIAREPTALAKQSQSNRHARILQMAGGDKPIAAVIPRPAQDERRPRGPAR